MFTNGVKSISSYIGRKITKRFRDVKFRLQFLRDKHVSFSFGVKYLLIPAHKVENLYS